MSKVFISTSCVNNEHITDSVTALAGVTSFIELSGGTRYQADSLALLKTAKEDRGLDFLLHSYFPPPVSNFVLNFADCSQNTRNFICTSIRYVNELCIPYYSVHAGYKQSFNFENELLVNGKGRFSLEDIGKNIAWFRQQFPEVPLALENLYPNNKNPDSCFATSVLEIEKILCFDERLLLLLDFGHLKISAHLLDFDFNKAVDFLFYNYAQRIVEIHLSENESVYDDHDVITEHSDQYQLLKKHRETILKNNINLTIEARGKDIAALRKSYTLVRSLFEEK